MAVRIDYGILLGIYRNDLSGPKISDVEGKILAIHVFGIDGPLGVSKDKDGAFSGNCSLYINKVEEVKGKNKVQKVRDRNTVRRTD